MSKNFRQEVCKHSHSRHYALLRPFANCFSTCEVLPHSTLSTASSDSYDVELTGTQGFPNPVLREERAEAKFSSLPTSFGRIQVLSHEVMLVPGRMILKRPKDAIPEFFVEGSCLETEGVEVCIGAAALDGIDFSTLHQLSAKAMLSHRRGYGKGSNVQPSRPNISE
jgi:hypothetical protein